MIIDNSTIGFQVTNEVVVFRQRTDPSTGVTGLLGFLKYIPGPYSLAIYSAQDSGGTQYSVQMNGSTPDSNKVLFTPINGANRGLLWAGDGVPATVYATYWAFGSGLRDVELNQVFYNQEIIIPILGVPTDGTFIEAIPRSYPYDFTLTDPRIQGTTPGFGDATFTLQDDELGTNTISIVVPSGTNISQPIANTIDILTTGGIVLKAVTVNGFGNGFLRALKGIRL